VGGGRLKCLFLNNLVGRRVKGIVSNVQSEENLNVKSHFAESAVGQESVVMEGEKCPGDSLEKDWEFFFVVFFVL